MSDDLEVRAGLIIPAADLQWTAVRSSGPGGQHVNRTATKVELRFDLPRTRALRPDVKARLRRIAAGRLDADGWLVVESQRTRSQVQNVEDARSKLADLVRAALIRPKRRRPTKPSRAAKRRRLEDKRKQGDKKRARRRVTPDDR